MSKINVPKTPFGSARDVSELLEEIKKWYAKHTVKEERSASGVWYRGMSTVRDDALQPGVYRTEFTERAKRTYGKGPEEKRLNLERDMLSEFRSTGARYFDANNIVEVYFAAQHFGMPTRLLDWTTNPLAALFFAAADNGKDGEVFVMEAVGILPEGKKAIPGFPKSIATMRHRYVTAAIAESFWQPWPGEIKRREPWILPVRPDNQPGRIGQQSSCFTLHMHTSPDCDSHTLDAIRVPSAAKENGALLGELRKLNINEFTIYDNLDNLATTIKNAWGVVRKTP